MFERVRLVLLGAAIAACALQPLRAENVDHTKRLRATGQCPSCDLSAARLTGLVLPNADLRNAVLSHAALYKVRLNDANLDGAVLTGANLDGADLTGASFRGANLSGANLRGAIGARLADATTDAATTCPDGARGPCVSR